MSQLTESTSISNEKELDLEDDIVGLTYTNSFGINHSQEEFVLLFGNMVDKEGRMVAKLIVTPAQAKRILKVILDNVSKYEEKFGTIAIPEPEEKEEEA